MYQTIKQVKPPELPEAPARRLKRRYLSCHCCGKRAVYYSTKQAACLCGFCLKAFDAEVTARRNHLSLDMLARRTIVRWLHD